MTYRPQYAYARAPQGYRDEDFEFYFDGFNTFALAQSIPVNGPILNIALALDRDAPFLWRGTKVLTDQPGLGVRFRGPAGDLLADDFGPVYQSYFPSAFPIVGFVPVPNEPGIPCPVGAVILLDLANMSLAPIIDPQTAVVLMGVKRSKVAA